MADGLKNIAGTPATVTIGGKEYRLTQWTPELIGEVEEYVVSLRPNPIVKTKEAAGVKDADGKPLFTPEEQQFMITEAIKQTAMMNHGASEEEVSLFTQSYAGACFLFWAMARTHQPEIDNHETARKTLDKLSEQEMELLEVEMMRASGMESLGNSPGQTQDEEETAPPE